MYLFLLGLLENVPSHVSFPNPPDSNLALGADMTGLENLFYLHRFPQIPL